MNQTRNWMLPCVATVAAGIVVSALVGCASLPSTQELDQMAAKAIQESFQDKNAVKVDRLKQDPLMALCSESEVSGKPLDEKVVQEIEKAAQATIHWPANGQFLGDWRKGEAIAQSGRGLTWTDDAKTPNGGNCYNCHQITKEEISYGTIGPSLYHYGRLRGVTDPKDPAAKAMLEYTWGKIWNPHAYNACSHMPRVGHNGILTEAQIRDVMALLLDPASPVNR